MPKEIKMVEEAVLTPRAQIDQEPAFYSFERRGVSFELSIVDLAASLEKHYGGGDPANLGLAARLRKAIDSFSHRLLESELPSDLQKWAERHFKKVLQEGGFRIVNGNRAGRMLVLRDWKDELILDDGYARSLQGGSYVSWSGTDEAIFSTNFWIT
jgi:hypothetical protein